MLDVRSNPSLGACAVPDQALNNLLYPLGEHQGQDTGELQRAVVTSNCIPVLLRALTTSDAAHASGAMSSLDRVPRSRSTCICSSRRAAARIWLAC